MTNVSYSASIKAKYFEYWTKPIDYKNLNNDIIHISQGIKLIKDMNFKEK